MLEVKSKLTPSVVERITKQYLERAPQYRLLDTVDLPSGFTGVLIQGHCRVNYIDENSLPMQIFRSEYEEILALTLKTFWGLLPHLAEVGRLRAYDENNRVDDPHQYLDLPVISPNSPTFFTSVEVKKPYRQLGIATTLLNHFYVWLQTQECLHVAAFSQLGMHLRQLYLSRGYQPTIVTNPELATGLYPRHRAWVHKSYGRD